MTLDLNGLSDVQIRYRLQMLKADVLEWCRDVRDPGTSGNSPATPNTTDGEEEDDGGHG